MTELHDAERYSIVLDTSIGSDNHGDAIIVEAVSQALFEVDPSHFWIRLPTHDYLGKVGRQLVRRAHLLVVGGTNLLTSNYLKYHQWKIGMRDILALQGKVVLMGVGWWQYQGKPDYLTRALYQRLLMAAPHMHSVRDTYTQEMLAAISIENSLNTGCPTMWHLSPEHCAQIPQRKADKVVVTLTDYKKDVISDRAFLELLQREYAEVWVWPQGVGDLQYLKHLGCPRLLSPTLEGFEQVLREQEVDYVGTRLHAGIRALQWKRRTIIVAVDNRAQEIAKDTGLWVVPRGESESLLQAIHSTQAYRLQLATTAIKQWKDGMRLLLRS